MALRSRANTAIGGPHLSDCTWDWNDENLLFSAFTNATTAQIFPISLISLATSSSVSGMDSVPFSDSIARIMGGQIVFPSIGASGGVAASSISTLGIAVYRSFGKLGAQITNAGGALTSLTVSAPGVTTPMPSGQTFNLTVAAGGTSQTWTTSAAVTVGALTIPVNSQTPGATYALGQSMIGQVGNGILWGWLGTASGTPAFQQNLGTVMPAITANITAGGGNTVGDPYGPFMYLQPGDMLALFGSTTSSTFSVPTGMVNTLIV